MKHYAVFINGVRGGTITFNNTDNGEELKRKLLTLSPTVNLREIDETDRCYREANPTLALLLVVVSVGKWFVE